MTQRILFAAALTALVSAAHAQGFRPGGGFMRMFQGGPMAQAMLLNREDVQEEIKLSDDQKGKLDAQRAAVRDKMRATFTQGGDASPEERQKTIQAMFEDVSKEALGVLTDDQRKRVKELSIQSSGALAVLQPDISKELAITEAQKVKFAELQRLQDEANAGLFERVSNGEIERDEMQKSMQKNSETLKTEFTKALTSAQRDKLKALSGAPFEFKDPKPGTPGSFGRPGAG